MAIKELSQNERKYEESSTITINCNFKGKVRTTSQLPHKCYLRDDVGITLKNKIKSLDRKFN